MPETDTNTITIGGKKYSKIGNIRGDDGNQGSCRNNLFIYERVPSTGGPGLAIEFNGKDYYYIESMGKIYQKLFDINKFSISSIYYSNKRFNI